MRAQGNPQSQIALLVFIIGVILTVYILALPPEDRALILEQNRTSLGDGVKDDVTVIITREPGTLSNIARDEVIHDLPAFNLFTKTQPTILEERDSIYIAKSLFDEQIQSLTFGVSDFENTDNFKLSFSAPVMDGRLTITLNDIILLNRELNSPSPAPISLPIDLLESTNTLTFAVSGPGAQFWKTNEGQLDNLKITADVTDTSSRENKQFVYITEVEEEFMESLDLSMIVECRAIDNEPLEVYLNKRLIYQGVPDCGSPLKVPTVDASRLRQGENDILYRTDEGNYNIYRVEAVLQLKQPVFPTYYFTLSKEDFKHVDDDLADLNVTLLFPNDEEPKKGFVYVNGFRFEINRYDKYFNRKVNDFVREGNNAVEIRPDSDRLDVVELQVLLAE